MSAGIEGKQRGGKSQLGFWETIGKPAAFVSFLDFCFLHKKNIFWLIRVSTLSDPPIVAIEPDGVIPVNETSSIQLWCTFDANPTNISEAIWFKDGQAIDFDRWSAEKLWTSKDERGTPILTVNDIDRNDSAEYRCRVRNHLGVADSLTSAKLEVACKYNGKSEKITVICLMPSNHNLSPTFLSATTANRPASGQVGNS